MKAARVTDPVILLNQELQARGWSVKEFAKRAGIKEYVAEDLVHGRQRIAPFVAMALSKAFGTSAEMWLRMEVKYQEYLDRAKTFGI